MNMKDANLWCFPRIHSDWQFCFLFSLHPNSEINQPKIWNLRTAASLQQSLLIFWKYKYHALELDGSRTSFKDFFPCNSIFQCLEIHVIIFLRWRVFRIHCERITKWNDTFNLQNVKRNKNKVYLNILVFKLSGYVRKQTNFKLPWIQTKPNMWESDLSSLLGSAIVHNSEQTW